MTTLNPLFIGQYSINDGSSCTLRYTHRENPGETLVIVLRGWSTKRKVALSVGTEFEKYSFTQPTILEALNKLFDNHPYLAQASADNILSEGFLQAYSLLKNDEDALLAHQSALLACTEAIKLTILDSLAIKGIRHLGMRPKLQVPHTRKLIQKHTFKLKLGEKPQDLAVTLVIEPDPFEPKDFTVVLNYKGAFTAQAYYHRAIAESIAEAGQKLGFNLHYRIKHAAI